MTDPASMSMLLRDLPATVFSGPQTERPMPSKPFTAFRPLLSVFVLSELVLSLLVLSTGTGDLPASPDTEPVRGNAVGAGPGGGSSPPFPTDASSAISSARPGERCLACGKPVGQDDL